MAAEHCVDSMSLDAFVAALTRSSTAALDTAHELHAHYSDTGDAPTQRSVDILIDQAAATLAGLTQALSDPLVELAAPLPCFERRG